MVDAAFEEPNPKRLRRTYAVVVVHDGRIVAERYAPAVTADMPMPGWSMAKSVLGTLVGILVDQGRLRLDQRELLPEWRTPDPRAQISLDDLLRATPVAELIVSSAKIPPERLAQVREICEAHGVAVVRSVLRFE